MKKLFLMVAVVLTAFVANAQDNKWNIGFGGGIASPMGSDFKDIAKVGAGYYLNCTYNFTPKLSAGLEYNGAGLVGASVDGLGTTAEFGTTSISSYLLKGVYYFTETKVRPYGAITTGLYNVSFGSAKIGGVTATESESKTNFGFGAELGLKIKWFNLGISYQNAGKVNDIKVAYMQYNVGFNIGF